MKKNIKSVITDLRKNAEELLLKRSLKGAPVPAEVETMKLLHELEVHQIELEMQNEELMQAKEQAEVSSKKYSELYDFAPTGYFTLSKEGKIIELNLSGAIMLGKERHGLKNSRFHFFLSEYSKPLFNLFLNKVFDGQYVKSCEVNLLTDNSSLKYVYLTGLLTENGDYCLVNAVDITERKNAEEKLKKKSDELTLAGKEIDSQAEEIHANTEREHSAFANRKLRQFAFITSRELQEPVSIISDYLRTLRKDYGDLLDVNALKYLDTVKDAASKMSVLINSLLKFSRLGPDNKPSFVDCKQLIDNVIADLESIITTSNAVIEVGDMPELYLYETEMRQLFQNLILNAIKFRKVDIPPLIHIKSEKTDDEYKFSISDNGIGIASDNFEKIFDIFESLNNDAEFEGNGTGLALSKKIVHLHNGKIWVESKLGHGSIFYFTIPDLTVKQKNKV